MPSPVGNQRAESGHDPNHFPSLPSTSSSRPQSDVDFEREDSLGLDSVAFENEFGGSSFSMKAIAAIVLVLLLLGGVITGMVLFFKSSGDDNDTTCNTSNRYSPESGGQKIRLADYMNVGSIDMNKLQENLQDDLYVQEKLKSRNRRNDSEPMDMNTYTKSDSNENEDSSMRVYENREQMSMSVHGTLESVNAQLLYPDAENDSSADMVMYVPWKQESKSTGKPSSDETTAYNGSHNCHGHFDESGQCLFKGFSSCGLNSRTVALTFDDGYVPHKHTHIHTYTHTYTHTHKHAYTQVNLPFFDCLVQSITRHWRDSCIVGRARGLGNPGNILFNAGAGWRIRIRSRASLCFGERNRRRSTSSSFCSGTQLGSS